jgi:hypothetical protein
MPKHPIHQPAMFDNPQLVELPAQPHPLIVAWMEWERRAEEEARAENRETWPKNEDTYMGRRRIRIRDALYKVAEAKGYGLEHPEGRPMSVSFRIKGRLVEWSLEEQSNPHHVPLSKTELKKRDNVARGITTETIYIPTGTFKLVAETSGRKTQISERTHKPFERRIEELLRRFEKFVDATIADEIRSAEIHLQVQAEIRAEERPRRLKAMEGARWEYLGELAKDWQKARSLRSFIDAVERSFGKSLRAGRATAWLEWARARVDRLDPLSDGDIDARRIVGWRYEPDPSEYEEW